MLKFTLKTPKTEYTQEEYPLLKSDRLQKDNNVYYIFIKIYRWDENTEDNIVRCIQWSPEPIPTNQENIMVLNSV